MIPAVRGLLAVVLLMSLAACGDDEPTYTQELCTQLLEAEGNEDDETLLDVILAMAADERDLENPRVVEPRIWLDATLLLQAIADGEPSGAIQVWKDILIEDCQEEVAA